MVPKSIQHLIDNLAKLPTIGPKTAERLTFFLLKQEPHFLNELAGAIEHSKENLTLCTTCYTYAEEERCGVCSASERDQQTICVVEDFLDYVAIERARGYQGTYHVLHGAIAPLKGIGPRQLKISELEQRITPETQEIILATNPTMEGEATAMYIKKLLLEQHPHLRISRIAKGLPMGGDIEYADDVTITNSLNQRTTY